MISRVKRIVSVLCLAAALFSAALLPASGWCEDFRFVFLADSRSDSLSEPVNTAVLNPIIAQIKALSPPPAFVIYGGDMAYRGYTEEFGGYTFQAFKDLFKPLTSVGIPLYTAIGNHELYYQHPDNGFLLGNQQQYQQVFTENPSNGPPGYEGLVYSFESPGGDAFFAVLDPYYLTADVPSQDVHLGGHITYAQLDWLATQVAQTQATHKFLFIHTPYYYVTGGTPDEQSAADVSFTYLWQILDHNAFDFYACGHSHLYSRKSIDSSITPFPQPTPPLPQIPPWQNNVVQLLCGTCGADVDTTTPTVDPTLWHISQLPNTYYFSVVDISGSTMTVNSYGGQASPYQVIDSFTINMAPGAPRANFEANPERGFAPLQVEFTDNSKGVISRWAWDFGDGRTSTSQNPSHAYKKPGSYYVTLTVTGSVGSDSITEVIQAYNKGRPKAKFTVNPRRGPAPPEVHFTDLSTGWITAWAWDFGDPASGPDNTSTKPSPSHTYNSPGTYKATLTVTGPGGFNKKSATLKVKP
jgi:PKD repeat protein